MAYAHNRPRRKSLWAVVDRSGGFAWTRGGSSTNPKLMVYDSERRARACIAYADRLPGEELRVVEVRAGQNKSAQGAPDPVSPCKPDCYECEHRRTLAGSAHSSCVNFSAAVTSNPHGASNGWFLWPWDFDPTWLVTCTGFKRKED